MARIKGKYFYMNCHNGIVGLAPERVYLDLKRRRNIVLELSKHGRCDNGYLKAIEQGLEHFSLTPVFTFVYSPEPKRFKVDPWFTGDSLLLHSLEQHLKQEGGDINPHCDVDLMVPYTGSDMDYTVWESRPVMRQTCRAIATEAQFEEEFGLTTWELMR